MKRFILYGDMASQFCSEIVLEAKTIRDFILGISANYPNFRSFLIKKSTTGIQYNFISSKNDSIENIYTDIILPDDTYHVVPILEGSAGHAGSFLGNLAGGFLMGKIQEMLKPEDDGKPEYEIITTNSFIYTQNSNRAEQGTSIPVVYGQLRVPSKVIHSSIQNYDYNYDEARIYPVKVRDTIFSNSLTHKFIKTDEISDLRDSSDDEVFSDFADSSSDSTKRSTFENGSQTWGKKNEKVGNVDSENQSVHRVDIAGSKSKTSNLNEYYGPSDERQTVVPNLRHSWWNHMSDPPPKPQVYPSAGKIDYGLRPASDKDLCVENLTKNRSEAWRNQSAALTIGKRGNYQKLESISIFKSLDILSEGPIVGLCEPVTGFNRDNGRGVFPYGAEPVSLTAGGIVLPSIKYDFASSSFLSQNNTRDITPISVGANYNDFDGTILGNADPVDGISIKVDKPQNIFAASLGDFTFTEDPTKLVFHENNIATPDSPKNVSSNNLFLLHSGDGRLNANTNNDTSLFTEDQILPSKYLINETTEDQTVRPVFQLSVLAADNNVLKQDFSVGIGYTSESQEFEIAPDSETANLSFTVREARSNDRMSTATVFDLYDFRDDVDNQSFDNDIKAAYIEQTGSDSFASLPWSRMARLCYAGGNLSAFLTRDITINIGTITYTYEQRLSADPNDPFDDPGEWEDFTESYNISITARLSDYVDLSSTSYSLTVPSVSSVPNGRDRQNTTSSRDVSNDYSSSTYLTNLAEGSTKSAMGYLINYSNNFAADIFDSFNFELGNSLLSTSYNGTTYLKFGVGCLSLSAPGDRTGVMPTHVISGLQILGQVSVMENGSNPEDTSDLNSGFYNPLLHPRVTIYTLRKCKIAFGTDLSEAYYWCPTRIDCVAAVSKEGVIDFIYLVNVPDAPVYDMRAERYTEIQPHDMLDNNTFSNTNANAFQSATQLSGPIGNNVVAYQDIGLICAIDPSHDSLDANLQVNDGSLQIKNTRRNSFIGELSWSDHIRLNNRKIRPEFPSIGAGFFNYDFGQSYINNANMTRNFQLSDLESDLVSINDTNPADISIGIERLSLSGGTIRCDALDTSRSFVYTGRPTSLTISNAGSGYVGQNGNNINGKTFSYKLFNRGFSVRSVKSVGSAGYRPNSTFLIQGISNNKRNSPIATGLVNFLARVTTVSDGTISDIEIIDPGMSFVDEQDILLMNSHDDFDSFVEDGFILESTKNLDPDIHLEKQNLKLKVDSDYFNQPGLLGCVSKFYILQEGLGFVFSKDFGEIFSSVDFTPPAFDVVIQNGSLQSIKINNDSPVVGYSSQDQDVGLRFSRPSSSSSSSSSSNTSDDPNAWARSIYLNDVPIRDNNKRFNYSKFHFDMRIGHYENGFLSTNNDIANELPASIDNPLMSTEFRLPSHTKMIDFALYGPRNNGDKDYYYMHTIKNPEVSAFTVAIRINKLHYIYEGDESALYVNLIPLIAVAIGIVLAESVKESVIEMFIPETVNTVGTLTGGTGSVAGCFTAVGVTGPVTSMGATTSTFRGIAAKIAVVAFISALAGAVAGFILAKIAKYLIKCRSVPFLCFKVGELIKNSGEIWPASVNLTIEYGVEGSELTKENIVVRGCATNEYVKDILIDSLPAAPGDANNFKNRIVKVYRTTREMDPVRGGLVESRYSISTALHSITEHVAGYFSYPNTALLGVRVNSKDFPDQPNREYLIKGRLIKVPDSDHYNPIDGTYSGTWNGTFDVGWTSNPAWIIYDLLINERYGMGKYGITESDIDKWSFYTFATFCDDQLNVSIDDKTLTERRHMCNLYVDSEVQAYDYIKDLLKIYNSSINFSGGTIYITTDKKGDSVMLFNNSNVTESGFNYSSTPETQRITAVSVDYLDERDNYMKKTEYVEDSQGISDYGYTHIKIAGISITRRGEAHRFGWHTILNRQIEKEIIQFTAGLEASYLRIGDVIEVMDNHKTANQSGGRIIKVFDESSSGGNFNLNIEIDVPTSVINNVDTLLIQAPESHSTDHVSQYIECSISNKSGNQLTISSSDSSISDVKAGFVWLVKLNDTDKIKPKSYRIKSISEKSNMTFEIYALEYLSEKYDSIDSSADAQGIYLEDREYYGHDINV